jgi:ElaB/YqjD/DUF883 family membrane-anchored ribosome-binding protein
MEDHMTDKTRDTLLKDVGKLKRDAVQIAQDVRDHATAHVDETKQKVTDGLQAVRDHLNTHPLAVLGVVFAAGVLFGLRMRR